MRTIILILLVLWHINIFAQYDTYLGFEFGQKWNTFQLNDPGGLLHATPLKASVYGITVSQELNKFAMLESGFFRTRYYDAVYFKNEPFGGIQKAFEATIIPIRIKFRRKICPRSLYVVGAMGWQWVINKNPSTNIWSEGSINTNYYGNFWFEAQSRYDFKKTFSLFDIYVGIEKHFKNGFMLGASANKTFGLETVIESNVTYTLNGEPQQHGTYTSHGNYFQILMCAKYPISRLWK